MTTLQQTNAPLNDQQPQMALPTPRALLTTLITSISTIPLLPIPEPGQDQDHDQNPAVKTASRKHALTDTAYPKTNPLRRVPPSHRHLITTLHVLFPDMVLPALDTLERGLVGKVTLISCAEGRDASAADAGGDGDGNGERCGEKREQDGNSFYLVHSTASVRSEGGRRYGEREGGGQQRRYIVRLGAWHCTCAAFAFAAVQGDGVVMGLQGREGGKAEQNETELGWSFGGMSLDGLDEAGGAVPVCKHLLACLLAEKWGTALGRYVVERRVGREEMAGIVADV